MRLEYSCIPDFNLVQTGFLIFFNIDVDWKVSINVTHLVKKSTGNTNDQVIDESPDSSKSGNAFASTMVKFNGDDILPRPAKGDSDM